MWGPFDIVVLLKRYFIIFSLCVVIVGFICRRVKVKRKKKKDAKWSKAVEEISGQEYINKLKAQ